jgi:hypothetical protein
MGEARVPWFGYHPYRPPATAGLIASAANDAKPMRNVSDDFLLNMAEVSGALLGLFLVGVFFYLETGFRRLGREREVFEDYMKAGTRIVMLLFAIPLMMSLTMVVLEPAWNRVLFVVLSVALIAANVDSAIQIRDVQRVLRAPALVVNEIVGTLAVVLLVTIPWILGGLDPSREDLTWAVLLSFGTAFLSVLALVVSVFDIARAQRAGAPAD